MMYLASFHLCFCVLTGSYRVHFVCVHLKNKYKLRTVGSLSLGLCSFYCLHIDSLALTPTTEHRIMAELCDVYVYEDQGARDKDRKYQRHIWCVCVWLRPKE